MNRDAVQSLHDLELAALATAGDRRAFGELVRRHNAGVRGVLMRMGADPATADDVAQDAFITAFSRISEFRGQGAFPGCVKRIAARQYLKRLRRRPPEPEPEAEGWGGEGESAARMDLDQALAGLPETERICVTLCYGAGFSHSEAAATLDLPLGTVKSHVKRGLDRLRVRLGPPAADKERAHV
ncbi:MAG: sigma-70 family RNA polymerase sigma factor [Proteobacteria bacterium]|nr:sigma-70 family RNA polymerase sigma factor [Pseudomonadota bacterium]